MASPHSTSPSVNDKDAYNVDVVETSGNKLANISSARKNFLLAIYCLAQFTDTFNNSALLAAIPPISIQLGISNSNSVWLLSAYQLTFAAFLLTSGRLSDVYNASYVFMTGAATMGFFALGSGFIRSQVPLIVLRALMGISASLTVPSALHLIIALFPDPVQQARAVSLVAATAGIGNVLGLIIGALFVSFTSWPWVFYFITIVSLTSMLLTLFFTPRSPNIKLSRQEKREKFERLDIIGVSLLTVALILFIFAITSGSSIGWGTARVIANLVISVILTVLFFIWEAYIPENLAALPPKMWRYPNFGILVFTALLPFFWWGAVMLLYSWLWQEVYGWSTIITAVHFLPLSLVSLPFNVLTEKLQHKVPAKHLILIGLTLALLGTVLLPFADSKAHYWRFAFPAFCIGTAGITMVFTIINIVLFAVTPPEAAGIVGAIFNCALELGSAAGVAIITSIQTSVQLDHGGPDGYTGRAAAFWFLFAFVVVEIIAVLLFMQTFTIKDRSTTLVKDQDAAEMQERATSAPNSESNGVGNSNNALELK